MVRLTDRPAMTIAVDLGRKATKQTNKFEEVICWNYVPQPKGGGQLDMLRTPLALASVKASL